MPKKPKTKKKSSKGNPWFAATAGETATASSRWPTLGCRVDPGTLEDMRDLARRLSREQGKRVGLGELVTEAMQMFLKKHQG